MSAGLSQPSEIRSPRLMWSLGTAIVCRILLNTSRRFVYPFAPALGRGLGVPLTAITSLIALNQATAVIGLFFGPVSDRAGYRVMMLGSLLTLAVGMLGAACLPFYGVVMLAFFMAGLGKSIFDPAIQAFVGERVSYERRGQAVGFLEVSWAGSSLVGIPAVGFLMQAYGWRVPFFVLGILALAGLGLLAFLLPRDRQRAGCRKDRNGWLAMIQSLVKSREALGAVGFAFFFNAANDVFFVVYGAWLEASFSISIAALGAGTAVIGLAELCGEGLTASISDRLGLKKSVLIGACATVMSYALIPFFGNGLTMAFAGIFLIFLAAEFSIVTSIALFTEILPGSRATMIAAVMAAAGLGRVAGALVGGPVWMAGGIAVTGLVSAAISLAAIASLSAGLKGWRMM
ncbi:MAG: MFS transporter [Deltaproteobacteria bacterium]|nr:MFS transporter [Deltaproteobacteria bacterium]